MAALITGRDLDDMKAFPTHRKTALMRLIMTQAPAEERNFQGNTDCAKAIRRLRADGLQLIDLQQHDCFFSSVWHKRERSLLGFLLGRPGTEVAAMVVWESNGDEDDSTTVRTWQI
jgi:hypothetical protein